MARRIQLMAGEHPVEAAIREGRIPESRRDHYMRLHAKKPKKTARLLASLEPVLPPQEEVEGVRQYVEQRPQAAPVAAGPTDYPEQWTGPVAVGGNIFTEKDTGGPLPPVQPGEIL